MRAVAAGHPATAEAGAEILEDGGSAADAVVAACLASCVAETVMTGLLGGGHAIHFDARVGRASEPRLLRRRSRARARRASPSRCSSWRFRSASELVHYAVGIGSCGVPGVPAGLDALWQAHGRLPWARLVEPALRLARGAVPMPAAHAACLVMLEPVMTMNEGARIYSPGGALLGEGDLLRQPGLVAALEALAEEGPRSALRGDDRPRLARAHGGARRPGHRGGPLDLRGAVERAGRGRVPRLRHPDAGGSVRLSRSARRAAPSYGASSEPERALALVGALLDELPAQHGTTNISALDAEGNACVLTTSLGLGSGDFVPGFDLHLNSMLGEADLLVGDLEPGERMASMMAPCLALDGDGVALAAGAAGGTRLRSALLQVVAGILDEGLEPQAAVDRPRLHPAGSLVHLEPGFGPETTGALESAGFEVRAWPTRHHYFGGVSAVTRNGAAGDPRRSGEARVV